MLALGPSTSDLVRVTTGSAADVEITYSFVTYSNAVPPVVQVVDGEPLASVTTATTQNILLGAASTCTVIKGMSLFNRSATSTTVLVEHLDASDTVGLAFCTLLQNEWLLFTESGLWVHYDANGAAYPSVGNAASQADMEAATATDMYVSPGRLRFHPGVAKVVCMTTGTATPVNQTPPSFGVTSITDNGVGDLTVTFSTAFSTANYCVQAQCEMVSTTLTEAGGNVMRAFLRQGTIATGSVRVNFSDFTATTHVLRDPISCHITCWGDQ